MNYPVGTPGVPWGPAERRAWLARQLRKRSYADDVLAAEARLGSRFEVVRYGRLDFDPDRYPLVAYRSEPWRDALPIVAVTGGVHGYETSGVHGALRFLERHAADYAGKVNLLVAPCISPWGYETIQRWNMHAVDPNRSFGNGAAQEAAAFVKLVAPIRERVLLHIDLHETTDSDEGEFRPALAARDGKPHKPGMIPDGFYVVDDTGRPQTKFQSAVIAAVARVTHIAEPDAKGLIIGSKVVAPGVIRYPLERLGLCAGATGAPFRTTTEVYPDSPRTSPEQCNVAQAAAVCAAIDFALEHHKPGKKMKKPAASPGTSAAELISKRIAGLADWRGETLGRMRKLIRAADPKIVEEWKWGVPVWSREGIVCTGETYQKAVKLTFPRGASVKDPKRLFNASLAGNTRRAIDIGAGDKVDASAFKALVRAAVALNRSSRSKVKGLGSRRRS